jgi:CYTH domain-containing protein
MGKEIERRYLLQSDAWRGQTEGVWLKQGYLSVEAARTVRVRIQGERAWLTLKSAISAVSRHEFEYPIPLADAETILATMCPMVVEKQRHRIEHGGLIWEVDVFAGDNAGLVLAEVELAHEDQAFEAPPWLGAEVTHDPRYTNAYLSQHPWPTWGQDGQ